MALEQCPQRDGPFEGTASRLQPKKLDWAVRHVSSVLISIQFVIHVARLSEISNRARDGPGPRVRVDSQRRDQA